VLRAPPEGDDEWQRLVDHYLAIHTLTPASGIALASAVLNMTSRIRRRTRSPVRVAFMRLSVVRGGWLGGYSTRAGAPTTDSSEPSSASGRWMVVWQDSLQQPSYRAAQSSHWMNKR